MLDKTQLELVKGLLAMNLGETIEDFEKPSTVIRDPIAPVSGGRSYSCTDTILIICQKLIAWPQTHTSPTASGSRRVDWVPVSHQVPGSPAGAPAAETERGPRVSGGVSGPV